MPETPPRGSAATSSRSSSATVAEPAEAATAAERLLEQIVEPIDLGPEFVSVAASIGIALGGEPELLLKEADAAMYRAKAQRDAGYAFFDPVLDSSAVERSRRAAELRLAVERGEFTLDFQPVVDLGTRTISGYEALLRWEHPEHGRIPPLDFIPLAEETGLIVPLGKLGAREACREARICTRSSTARSHVRQRVGAPAAAPRLRRARRAGARASGFRPPASRSSSPRPCCCLPAIGSSSLRALKEMGIMLALDDFGTGYASLAYLRRFPVDIVKIDRSFTAAIDGVDDDLVLLKGIVDLGNALGLTLVAEGIETEHQRRVVGELGCHGAQGFYFGSPDPVPALSAFV